MLKKSADNRQYKVYAVVAPSIAGQFKYAKLEQVITGIKRLGFFSVVEAALGADMIADEESKELVEAEFLTTSCCPAFVKYIETQFPELVSKISAALSPMAAIAKYIKHSDPSSKIIFIGPCTAKKLEFQRKSIRPYVDSVITFEELQALFDSKGVDITSLEETCLDNASYFGRIFARSGGVTDAVREAVKENGVEGFEFNPLVCDGIEQCRTALLKLGKNMLPNNFIEGMACVNGCIGGAGCLTHEEKNKADIDRYGMKAYEKSIKDAISAPFGCFNRHSLLDDFTRGVVRKVDPLSPS
jgi:iron only hydrogenase large subunit-like protein